MITDTVYKGFLSTAALDAERCNRKSPILRVAAVPASGSPPSSYLAVYRGIEHMERAVDGTVSLSARPVPVLIHFPADFLRSVDATLQFRVARVNVPLFHPNCRGDGTLCLGNRFQPGTSLPALVETLYGILSNRVVATDHAFDVKARDYFLNHVDEVGRLQDSAPPLWDRPVAARVRSERLDGGKREEECQEGGQS